MPETKEKAIEGDFTEKTETSLAVVPPREVALSTQDPEEFIGRAVKQADALKKIIDAKKLAVYIGGGLKAHVLIDGWQTLMALNGVMPYTVESRQTRCVTGECQVVKDCRGQRLTVHVITEIRRVSDGAVLTRVESECSQHERRWAGADDYAVISMAQTRGVGKGCRQLFGWVMALAGFSATPAEEMPPADETPVPVAPATPAPMPIGEEDQVAIRKAFDWYQAVRSDPRAKKLSKDLSDQVIRAYADLVNRDHSACCSITALGKWKDLWAHGGRHVDELRRIFGIDAPPPAPAVEAPKADDPHEAEEAAASPGSADGVAFDPEAVTA